MLSTDKLKNKEVINIYDGRSIGFVSDIEVNIEKGTIEGIVIPAERGLFGFFGKSGEDLLINWDKVRTVGDDVILVDMQEPI
ncbi:MAG: YlmC/YmxH family sporulation protein [Firmicutes bacterium]|nr:YlmC/YmxH family sporulation protein [Bacillota bacterium]